MKKSVICLFMFLCSLSVLISCKDDDEYYITDTDLNGVYFGTLDVDAPLNGVEISVKDIKQKIYITKTNENLVKFELKNFVFTYGQITMPLGDIVVNDIKVSKNGDNFSLVGEGAVDLQVGHCNVTIHGNVTTVGVCDVKIDVEVTGSVPMQVKVDFKGKRVANDQSSEAVIQAFDFNSEKVTQVDVNENTVQFLTLDTVTILTFAPIITVSEGATVTPASGTTQDFSSPVTYTVVSEDGIVTHQYVVSHQGKVKKYSFDEWKTDANYGFETPSGSFATTNEGSSLVYAMLEQLKTMPSFADIRIPAWCVRPTDKGKTNKGAVLETIDLTDAKDALKRYAATLPSSDAEGVLMIEGMCPYITAGSAFLGSFDLFAALGDPLTATKFGVEYTGSKLVKFSGWYKYTPGSEFHNENNEIVPGRIDECAIYAILYEAKDAAGKEVTLTGKDVTTSEYVILKAEVADKTAKADWTYFEIPFEKMNNKDFNPEGKYKLAVICTSSKEGDHYKGAPGSTLYIDDFELTME